LKTLLYIIIITVCCSFSTDAQKIYETWIHLKDEPFLIKGALYLRGEPFLVKGVLYEIKDSSVVVSNSVKKSDYKRGRFEVSEIEFDNIDSVQIRRKYKIIKGMLIGGVTGAVIGGYLGYSQPEDRGFMAIEELGPWGAKVGMVPGVLTGAIIGQGKNTIPINGNYESFLVKKEKLRKYSIKGQADH